MIYKVIGKRTGSAYPQFIAELVQYFIKRNAVKEVSVNKIVFNPRFMMW